jgi:general secretion pathway protein E
MKTSGTISQTDNFTQGSLDSVAASCIRCIERGEEGVPDLADAILTGAEILNASDIHVEASRDAYLIRYRVDGVLVTVATLPKPLGENLIGRFKLLAQVMTYRKRIPQDGRVDRTEGLAARAAFIPTLHGEKAVLRLSVTHSPRSLEELGMPADDLERFQRALLASQGVIIFTGPCSSGKSTSIYASLRYILDHSPLRPNVVTLENPIEQEVEGANQTQIDPAGGLTFLTGLRTLLRMDPDVIVVGEIRDEETANTAIQAGLSGHRVLTTIHSGTAAQVYARLLHMEIEPFLLAGAVTAVVAQRLARRMCPHCGFVRKLDPWEAQMLFPQGAPEGDFASARGCAMCMNTGVSGRIGLFETGFTSPALREALVARAPTEKLADLLEQEGMCPLRCRVTQALAAGAISIEEAIRVLGGVMNGS